MIPLLKAEGIQKAFQKGNEKIPIIRGVDIEVKAQEMVAIMGASGVGKSTLLHILGGLEPPTVGRVLFGSPPQNIFSYSDAELSVFRNRSLGYIFQFHYLLPEFTALENVMMPALIAGHTKGASEKQARQLLEFVGLGHRLTHRPPELSGGEQQRVAVARSIVLRPKLLLADEPTGNLDSANSEHIFELLKELNRSTGVSVLLVTHDAELAKKMHRVLFMKDGRIVSFVDSVTHPT